jgi:hypothetical protein
MPDENHRCYSLRGSFSVWNVLRSLQAEQPAPIEAEWSAKFLDARRRNFRRQKWAKPPEKQTSGGFYKLPPSFILSDLLLYSSS